MKQIDVCLTPELLSLYDLENKVVVVIDILRATSCMTTALANGVAKLIPVASLDECKSLQQQGFLAAAERDGMKAEGFDLGNSPFSYMEENVKGKTIAMTTTNGTLAISLSKTAKQIVIGSFLNISTVAEYLEKQPYDVILLCAGWKGHPNIEDTLFAGAVADMLKNTCTLSSDSTFMAQALFKTAENNILEYIQRSSHVQRLHRLNIWKDIEFCLSRDIYKVLPVYEDGCLQQLKSVLI